MRWTIAMIVLSFTSLAHAQREAGVFWLDADYTYSDIAFSGASNSGKGDISGIRGDFGMRLLDAMSISIGGEYQDGNLHFDSGAAAGIGPTKAVTSDYIRETHLLVHYLMGATVLSTGLGQREWYDVNPATYRQRQFYDYVPLSVKFYRESIYLKLEYDYWRTGHNKSKFSDLNGGLSDIEFSQNSGSGYGIELGYLIPSSQHLATQLHIKYHRWTVGDSDVQKDAAVTVSVPKNDTATIQAGIGLGF